MSGQEYARAMRLTLRDNLPFTTLTLTYQGTTLNVSHVLVDTGSATTLLAADLVATIGIIPIPQDVLHILRGVGGSEVVFARRLDALQVGACRLTPFDVEIGAMDYGFAMGGILGMDFLRQAGALLDLRQLTIVFPA